MTTRLENPASTIAETGAGLRPTLSDEVSLFELLSRAKHRWRAVLTASLTCFALTVVVTLVRGARYTVSTSFLLQGGTQPTAAAGLAARFGVVLPQNDPGQSAQFYGSLAQSNEVLRRLVQANYSVDSVAPGTDLLELFESEGRTRDERVEDAIQELRHALRITLTEETGLVRINVTTRWRSVSLQVASNMLEVLDSFNIARRQRSAAAERVFTEAQSQEAEASLRAAEDSLQVFLENNRRFQSSPELVVQHDRLVRSISMRQAQYTSLEQALDAAELDEVRNTPLIAVVEPPRAPARADRRFLLVKGLMALIIGAIFGGGAALAREAYHRAATSTL